MGAQYVDPFGRARGTKQWIVRGQIFLGEQREGLLRPRIDEYPERWPINPMFPQPGNRAGSRAPVRQGGSPVTGVAGGPGGEIPTEVEVQPVVDIYPYPRERNGDNVPVGGSLPPISSPEASAPQVCAGGGGAHLQIGINLAAAANQVNVSNRIDRPFRITHVEHYSDGSPAAKTQFRLKIATDNDATGGLNATGSNLDELNLGGDDFLGDGQVHRSYPGRVVTSVPVYLKFCHDNQTAAQRAFQTIVNIEYLD